MCNFGADEDSEIAADDSVFRALELLAGLSVRYGARFLAGLHGLFRPASWCFSCAVDGNCFMCS
jgi:hypothetical protein